MVASLFFVLPASVRAGHGQSFAAGAVLGNHGASLPDNFRQGCVRCLRGIAAWIQAIKLINDKGI